MNFDKNSISRKRKELTSASTMVGSGPASLFY